MCINSMSNYNEISLDACHRKSGDFDAKNARTRSCIVRDTMGDDTDVDVCTIAGACAGAVNMEFGDGGCCASVSVCAWTILDVARCVCCWRWLFFRRMPVETGRILFGILSLCGRVRGRTSGGGSR